MRVNEVCLTDMNCQYMEKQGQNLRTEYIQLLQVTDDVRQDCNYAGEVRPLQNIDCATTLAT